MQNETHRRARRITGWIAVVAGTLVAALWAFWGIIENFHEGWFPPTLAERLFYMMLYMSPMLFFMGLPLLAVRWPRLGAIVYFALSALFSFLVLRERWERLDAAILLSWLPVTLVPVIAGLLFWFGRPQPRRWAYRTIIGIPLLVVLLAGAEPAWRVAHRVDDGNRSARLIEGHGIRLIWAPAGPGWARTPQQTGDWEEARCICARLTNDGTRLADEELNIWRLPTVDEVVRSMTRAGKNAGGVWNPESATARYDVSPDKESPLWDTTSGTIYYWTATSAGSDKVYAIVYHGGVNDLRKDQRLGSLGFRAVRTPTLSGE
ncbi:MAG: DUF1566 domain-containing protein [Acidobacteria bacterium]|nr:DUF1566 domain-containing protein [Acidobacteriota bacterium]